MQANTQLNFWHCIFQTKYGICLEAAAIALLPCVLLFSPGTIFMSPDWYNHLWYIAYSRAYFHDHHSFLNVINTPQIIGYAGPVFYGHQFYPVMAVLGVIFSASASFIISTYMLYCIQHGILLLLLVRMNFPRWFSSACAAMVTLAIYPLTNLYNRGAFTEFFATGALTIAIAALWLCFLCENKRGCLSWYCLALIALGFMGSSHPITLMNGAVFIMLLCPLLLWIEVRHRVAVFCQLVCIPTFLSLLLSPLLYAIYMFHNMLGIEKENGIQLYPNSVDSLEERFSPMPDNRILFDAPANIFLLACAGLLLYRLIRQHGWRFQPVCFCALMIILFLFYTWCSISLYPYTHILPRIAQMVQFPYRMISMINLCALCAILGMGAWLKNHQLTISFSQREKTLIIPICIMAVFAFSQKMTHASVVMLPIDHHVLPLENDKEELLNLPMSMYGKDAYTTTEFYVKQDQLVESQEITLNVSDNPFGDVAPYTISAEKEGWYKTNVYAFLWNQLWVDGNIVMPHVASDVFAVYLKSGPHIITYVFNPPIIWRYLNYLSTAVVVVGLLVGLVIALWARRSNSPAYSNKIQQ